MTEKKRGVSERRGAGRILLATTLAGTAATSAMAQSTTTGAISLKGLFEKSITQKVKEHPILALWIVTVLSKNVIKYTHRYGKYLIHRGGNYLRNKLQKAREKEKLEKPKEQELLNEIEKEKLGKTEKEKLLKEIEEELNLNIDIFFYDDKDFVLFSKLDRKTRINITRYYHVDKEKTKNSKKINFKLEEEPQGKLCIKIVNEKNETLVKSFDEDILLESLKYREYMKKHDISGSLKKKIENYNENVEYCKYLYDKLNDKFKIRMVKGNNGKHLIYIEDEEKEFRSEYKDKDIGNFDSEDLEFGIARSFVANKDNVRIDIRSKNNVKKFLYYDTIRGHRLKKYIENGDPFEEYLKKVTEENSK